jgi:hypothetical protein
MSWSRTFDDPITLPDGRILRTLRDAGNHIASLPKRQHDAPERQAAIEALMLVVERGGPTMLARVGIMRTPVTDAPKPAHRRSNWSRPELIRGAPADDLKLPCPLRQRLRSAPYRCAG